ncbi:MULTISPECIES: sulfur oxidation c-type cytochrome SoxX [Pacificibacter]|uniref:sulfur oxidation c-type cytochrome SoxX n=1 Tax=Pacificibacter TaxID=1042323 RepID=UPI001C090F3B|nr:MULTISPECIES: sulfur oxidation c-type cytochrome SoxX [Pacificibacter]MBU2935323.1 sulfur oxidation c-type cytochrome SoxX [Pacificibacter marinus]MDO6615477.1 sulfur oxidation c-type cytochrome SoxX [Pacificibacter sp. 1_MG-2023]
MKRIATTLVVLGLTAGAALAEVTPNDVAYVDGAIADSLTGVAGNAEKGREILTSKSLGNCVACHAAEAYEDISFHGEIGPMLDGVGSRWEEAEVRGIVANAKMTFEGTIMPAFYKTNGYIRPGDAYTGKAATGDLPPLLSAQQIEDVVAYLMTLKDE